MLRTALLVLYLLLVLPAVAATHRISVGDELQISIVDQPELSSDSMVRPDGSITLPLLNDLQVKGLTVEQLEKTLRTQFAKFIREPRVCVVIQSRGAGGSEFKRAEMRRDLSERASRRLLAEDYRRIQK